MEYKTESGEVMTTPNIDGLIDRLYDWHNTSAEQNRLDMQKAADLLQSQAERINTLGAAYRESLDEVSQRNYELRKENDTLRAQLAAIAATEPVAEVGGTFTLYWVGSGPIEPIVKKYGIKVGDKLFTRPMPAQDVAELAEAAYDKVQRLIVDRYHVEKSIGGFWPCCVKAGDGTMDIFVGSKKQAENVRQALQTACLDGAFMASKALSKYKGAK